MAQEILVLNGPNLNLLGKRDPTIYGKQTLSEIESTITTHGRELGIETRCFQSNSEGRLIDFLQEYSHDASGIIINPGALTHYGLALREALVDTALPIVEIHISNIYAREKWRHRSVIAPIATAHISGLGHQGYMAALEFLVISTRKGGKG